MMETAIIKHQLRFDGVKILLADDALKNLQVLAGVFNDTGAKISFAMNGKQAVDQSIAFMPDLILLDVSMPVLDGIAACEAIKSNPLTRDIPIIFLTAKTETDDVVSGLMQGAADYITKPFQSAELLARVRTHLELSKARKSLLVANKQMAELVAIRDRLLSIIAHDLRSPIGNLNQLLDLISIPEDGSPDAELLSLCRSSASEAFGLLENLLNWAKGQYKESKVNKSVINVYQLISNVVRNQNSAIKRKNQRVVLSEDLGHTVCCDACMMDIVLRNLLSNAIKFTPIGGEICISTQKTNDVLEIHVSDSGVGISEELISKIFLSHTQHSTLGTANEKGSGLGLMICKEFVEKNCGTIHVKSVPDEGATFIVRMPAV